MNLPNKLGDFHFTAARVTFIQNPRFSRDYVKVDAGSVWLPDCRALAGVFNHLANLYESEAGGPQKDAVHPTQAARHLRVMLAETTNEFRRAALSMAIERLEREGARCDAV